MNASMMWIDNDTGNAVGKIGYLVESTNNQQRGSSRFTLRDRPLRTNVSHEPRLIGWCGETNQISRTAHGVWMVTRINSAGDRIQVLHVIGKHRDAFLAKDGYPGLIPAKAVAA